MNNRVLICVCAQLLKYIDLRLVIIEKQFGIEAAKSEWTKYKKKEQK